MKKRIALHQCANDDGCSPIRSRRDVVRVGSWLVFLGALGGGASIGAGCGGPQIRDLGATGSATPTPTNTGNSTPTPTPSASPTATPDAACGCNTAPTGSAWKNLGIKASDIPMNGVAYNSTNQIYIGHDAQGFFAMDSICPHENRNMGASAFDPNDLSGGFQCPYHGATFDGNGNVTGGPASSDLPHWALTTDASGTFFVDYSQQVSASCRC